MHLGAFATEVAGGADETSAVCGLAVVRAALGEFRLQGLDPLVRQAMDLATGSGEVWSIDAVLRSRQRPARVSTSRPGTPTTGAVGRHFTDHHRIGADADPLPMRMGRESWRRLRRPRRRPGWGGVCPCSRWCRRVTPWYRVTSLPISAVSR